MNFKNDKEELINCFINHVEYYEDKIIVCCNLTDKNNTPVYPTGVFVEFCLQNR